MANRFLNPRPQFMNATPTVYASGILRFYASGTSTPQNVYSGSDLTGASTTITLNSAGRPSQDIFLSNLLYKVTLEDSLGNIIWTVDPYMTSDYTTTAKVTGYSGNPNTHVAGTASAGAVPADMVWDRTNHILYVCTTTGVAAAAVWTVANSSDGLDNWTTAGRNVSPVAGVDFGYNTTTNCLEYWNSNRWISIGQYSTTQTALSGTGAAFGVSTGAVRLRIRMVGPGGGGGAVATNSGANGSADTSFTPTGKTAWTAVKGSGGVNGGGSRAGGAGGSGGTDGNCGTLIFRQAGQPGGAGAGSVAAVLNPGPPGGGAAFFGGGGMPTNSTGANATGYGGGGGGATSNAAPSGGGGGSGEYVEFWINPLFGDPTSGVFTVGLGGAGGAAGTAAGGNGGNGIIIFEEFYS